jgi:hypothetical protein
MREYLVNTRLHFILGFHLVKSVEGKRWLSGYDQEKKRNLKSGMKGRG